MKSFSLKQIKKTFLNIFAYSPIYERSIVYFIQSQLQRLKVPTATLASFIVYILESMSFFQLKFCSKNYRSPEN